MWVIDNGFLYEIVTHDLFAPWLDTILHRSMSLRFSSSERASSSSRAMREKALNRLIAMSRIGLTRSRFKPSTT